YKGYENIEKREMGFLVLISAQKLGHETKNDTIFAYGQLKTKTIGNNTKIFIKEIRTMGYESFTKCDSIIEEFEEINNNKINFIKRVFYYKGKVKEFKFPKQEILPDSVAPPPPPKRTF
ncbi:hypothetical protein, partial [Flavobacterium sp.]|uniref:hypothetical protein n=1 Tax=Flavobacterium sp. TaxID=239 RepID=UPI003C315EE8